MKTRFVILADPRDLAAHVLVPELLRRIDGHEACRCAGLVLTGPPSPAPGGSRKNRVLRHLQAALGTGRPDAGLSVRRMSSRRLAREHAIPVVSAPGGDPNHAELVQRLRGDLQAEVAINIYCRQRFRDPLLSSFDVCINYHNGLLPRFRGLRASNWSLYLDEATSGYTFHRMDAGLDTGAILASGAVDVREDDTPADLEVRKAEAACHALPRVLDAAVGRDEGCPQIGMGGYHDRQAYLLATVVEDPSTLIRAEWLRRLRAFLCVRTKIAGRWLPVTGLKAVSGPCPLAFRTADGGWMSVSAAAFWPTWLALRFPGMR